MIFLQDVFFVKAAKRAEQLGLTEERDGPRWEAVVRAAYETERQRGHVLLKNSAIGKHIVKKSIGMKVQPKPHQVKRKPSEGRPVVGGWAQGQRPDQKASVQGRIMAAGKDGVVLKADDGRTHRIRHEHIIEHQAPVSEKEWPKVAKVMAESGHKVDPVSRFRKPEKPKRADAKTRRRLLTLAKKHKDLDAKRAIKEGSSDDLRALIEHYKDKPVEKLKKSEWEYGGAACPRCGGDGGNGLVDTNCVDCGHRFNPMTGRSLNGEDEDECCERHTATEACPCKVCRTNPRCRERVDVPDHLPKDIRNMKSMQVWSL